MSTASPNAAPVVDDEADGEDAPAPRAPRRRKTRVVLDHPDHGRIEIHHMRAVELDVTALADASGPTKRVWIQLAKVGQFAGHSAGPFELNAKVFADIVTNFKTTQNRAVPIDFEHASEADATSGSVPVLGAPAVGWIVDLDNRGEAGLWACVEWGARAAEYIKSGAYRYISPAVRFASRDRVTGKTIGARLTSAGLTNQPFLDGMQPLAASDREAADDNDQDEADDSAATNDGDRTMSDPAKPNSTTQKIDELAAENVALTSRYADLARAKAESDAKVKELEAKLALRDEADLKEIVADVVATYADKLPTKDEATLLALCKADPVNFRKAFPKVKAAEKHLLRDLTTRREPPPPSTKKPERVPSQEELRDKHLKDGKRLDEACNLAFKEHKALLAAARNA